ncbi:hypothetical protein GDO86_003561 [Hymenochirus boettgeri]|uniref:Uncharacterized protein n=1 Tax=Hymenochirus boettgeri TaxID=247094 RepID=A0A8T2K1I7_9PIPI|nr:hypothetical protein GDO86_003561 [Hymenochirus boettgeri]
MWLFAGLAIGRSCIFRSGVVPHLSCWMCVWTFTLYNRSVQFNPLYECKDLAVAIKFLNKSGYFVNPENELVFQTVPPNYARKKIK